MVAQITSLHGKELHSTISPLRQHRLQRGWTLQQVADALYQRCCDQGQPGAGINADTVGRWERGKSAPSARYQAHLCALFGTTPSQLGFAVLCPAVLSDAPGRSRRSLLSLETETCHFFFHHEDGLTIESATFPYQSVRLSGEDTEALFEALAFWKQGQQARRLLSADPEGDDDDESEWEYGLPARRRAQPQASERAGYRDASCGA